MNQTLRSLPLAVSVLSITALVSVGCAAASADLNEDAPVAASIASGELDTEGTGPWNCDSIGAPPADVGFSLVGTKRLAVTAGGVAYCGYEDQTLALGEQAYITGRLKTKACTSSSPTWTVYQGASALAFCKPGSLRVCNPSGQVQQYMASCISTLTFPGNPQSTSANVWANFVLAKKNTAGWTTLLNYKTSSASGMTGLYLSDTHDSYRYLTWGSATAAYLAYGRAQLSFRKGGERQLWRLY